MSVLQDETCERNKAADDGGNLWSCVLWDSDSDILAGDGNYGQELDTDSLRIR